jgi:hypothetical protein
MRRHRQSTLIIVQKATPILTWPTPSEVIDGAVLGSTGLKAVASVSGTFTYTPQAASSAISEPVISVTVPVGGRDGVEHRY